MTNLIIGAIAAAGFSMLLSYVRRHGLRISLLGWAVTALGFVYGIFVLEVVTGFLAEGSPQAAVVMGSILGFMAVVWGVLLGRLVFSRSRKVES